jgi:hypothetical protein
MLVHILKEKLLVLWKLVLLEGRILIYSIKSSHVSSMMLALLSLFPGQLAFDSNCAILKENLLNLSDFGLPLKIFNESYAVNPSFSLFQMDIFEKKSYLLGVTNRILIGHPQA